VKTGIELITEERADQIRKGWDAKHDDGHDIAELAMVASVVAANDTGVQCGPEMEDWGIIAKHQNNRIHQLAIAGALIAAEIDRLQREALVKEAKG
jgi:hypothetical protein